MGKLQKRTALALALIGLGAFSVTAVITLTEEQKRRRAAHEPVIEVLNKSTWRQLDRHRYTPPKEEPLDFTPAHLALLRNVHLEWLPWESGAPGIIEEWMFGSPWSGIDMARIVSEANRGQSAPLFPDLERLRKELDPAAQALFQLGDLRPGNYTIANTFKRTMGEGKTLIYADHPEAIVIPHDDVISFTLTEEHLRLIRRLNLGNAKRPYGDCTFMELDMADALGIPIPKLANGEYDIDNFKTAKLLKLHSEMLFATAVFLKNATLAPGKYTRDNFGHWHKLPR